MILPAFAEQVLELAAAGRPLTPRSRRARDASTCTPAPTTGSSTRADLDRLAASCGARCSASTTSDALDDLYARVVWIPDGELERLDDAAREYRRIVGEPDPPPSAGGAGEPGRIR